MCIHQKVLHTKRPPQTMAYYKKSSHKKGLYKKSLWKMSSTKSPPLKKMPFCTHQPLLGIFLYFDIFLDLLPFKYLFSIDNIWKGSTWRSQRSLWTMQLLSSIKSKSCWAQKGSTWKSQISLSAMQASSNIKRISCSPRKGKTGRCQLSFWAMQPSSNLKRNSGSA